VAHRDAGGGSRPLHHKRKFAIPKDVEHWSLTSLREKLIKIGAKAALQQADRTEWTLACPSKMRFW
jgi:hypothetical protein